MCNLITDIVNLLINYFFKLKKNLKRNQVN